MKPTKIKLALVFLLLLNFAMYNAQRFLTIVYIVQKVLLFMLLALLAYVIIDYFTKKLLEEKLSEKKFNLILISRTIIFGLSLVLIISMQLLFMNKRETLYVNRCEYYDLYNNLVYESQFTGVCPKLEVITQNEDEFIFRAVQEIYGSRYYSGFYSQGILEINDAEYAKLKSLSDVYVKYDNDHNVIEYDIKISEYLQYKQDNVILNALYSYHRNVFNLYIGSDFETIVKEGHIVKYNTVSYDNDVEHYEFSDNDYEVYHIYMSRDNLDDELKIDFNLIKETLLEDGSYEEELLGEVAKENFMTKIYFDDDHSEETIQYIEFVYLDEEYISIKEYILSSSQSFMKYEIKYKKEDNIFYLKRAEQTIDFSPEFYNKSELNYLVYDDNISGKMFMTNSEDRVYEFINTEYGTMIVEKRIRNFDFFRSNEIQLEEFALFSIRRNYEDIQNYEEGLFDRSYYSPIVIFRNLNPLIR